MADARQFSARGEGGNHWGGAHGPQGPGMVPGSGYAGMGQRQTGWGGAPAGDFGIGGLSQPPPSGMQGWGGPHPQRQTPAHPSAGGMPQQPPGSSYYVNQRGPPPQQ